MAVDQSPISVESYKPTVPIVEPTQVPEQDLQAQQPQRIYSKLGGIAQFADTAMKGLLKGLQLKEQKKFQTAEAVMKSQDAGIADARSRYENLLVTKGAFEADGKTPNTETQAAYTAWQQSVDQAAAQRQAFAIPDQKPKGSKDSKKKGQGQPDQVPAGSGFGAGLKQFFERNPHIVPELAIIGMKSQVTPYGQASPEAAAAKVQYDQMQRQEANQKVHDAAQATYDKYAGKTNLTPQQQEEFANAEAVLRPITPGTKYQVLVDPQGQQHSVPAGTEIPEGWKVYEKTPTTQIPRAGTEQEFTSQALKGYGYTNDTAPPDLLKYLHSEWTYRSPQTGSSTSGSTVDVNGNRTTTTSTTRGAAAPKPPAGFAPLDENGQPLKEVPKPGKMTAPPSAAEAPKAGGKMTPAPGTTPTLTAANRTMRVETQERDKYQQASNHYETARQKNDPNALANYNAEKAQIVLWKAGQIKAVGGDPWKKNGRGEQFVKFPGDDGVYGTMDGVNWVNINTGMPYGGK